jgi:hypothetical protein
MVPHTPEESPKVKTKRFRIGSCRLYAPMVPLAPHPCVRWWNTKMMPLKSTRLDLHSLKGGSPNELPPPRRRGYQRTGNGIPPTQRQWRKRDHGSLKRKPPKPKRIPQSPSPEGYHNSTNPTSGCTAPPQDFHWSTFSFSESRTAFSFALQKKKWFYPQGVRPIRKAAQPPTAGLWPQPGRQKTNCKIKTSRFPAKEKAVSPARNTPQP